MSKNDKFIDTIKPDDLFNAIQAGLFYVDLEGNNLYANDELCNITGFSPKSLREQGWMRCVDETDKTYFLEVWEQGLKSRETFKFEVCLRDCPGKKKWIQCICVPQKTNDKIIGYFGTVFDITEYKNKQKKLGDMARIDFLTGLPNRLSLHEKLSRALKKLNRHQMDYLALFYMDLDNFKSINTALGHEAGDELLKKASLRFKKLLRSTDFVARMGGDEFVILIDDLKSPSQLKHMADMIINKFKKPFIINDIPYVITVSIGIMLVDKKSEKITADKMLKYSDQALFRAKSKGRSRAEFYTRELNDEITRIIELENDIKLALENEQFSLAYQPQFDMSTRQIIGCEILIRWQHPLKGFISPANFIPVAEDAHLLNDISYWVIQKALSQWGKWQLTYPDIFGLTHYLSINLSALYFQNRKTEQIINQINNAIKEHHLRPETVMFELSEASLMGHAEKMRKITDKLSHLGIKIAIDDFGTGYSSLIKLKQLSLTLLKIDKSFVEDLEKNTSSQAITQAIISLAKALGIKVIAEGVETKEQAQFLLENGCNFAQGYYFSKPMPAEEFEKFMINYHKP